MAEWLLKRRGLAIQISKKGLAGLSWRRLKELVKAGAVKEVGEPRLTKAAEKALEALKELDLLEG